MTIKKALKTAQILGIWLSGTSEDELLKYLASRLTEAKKTFIVTPNTEFSVYAQRHTWFCRILNSADIAIPDGIGLIWASSFLYGRGLDRIHGTDLMEKLCRLAAKQGWTVYLLGGQSGIAGLALENLKKRYSGLRGWAETGPDLRLGTPACRQAGWDLRIAGEWVEKINQKKPDLLFVGFGMGKQEKFIADNWGKLEVKLAMGVGGAFDYFSGNVPRAPKVLRRAGLEWLYRLIRQPWRVRRQLALVKFVWLVIKEKFVFFCEML
jgi:N-acetylglucosaminyldiphosphoundecaprenol N-acetyl-beta-D-mannosaminyltransferase